ncbi:hypothetical protein AB833_15740 [Chromatiales bacterium (ex Bugula neritina AB1)]|nr:hypothetical protein AB833_15740 [Chromatiales bacterium (ex Bugula neritina AB1)]
MDRSQFFYSAGCQTKDKDHMIFSIIALFSRGTFFGAAIYISLAQHPAALEAGASVGGRFFPPMYKRAAPMQIALALAGFVSGVIAWFSSGNTLWLAGAVFLVSVVPITLMLIKPINDLRMKIKTLSESATGVTHETSGNVRSTNF